MHLMTKLCVVQQKKKRKNPQWTLVRWEMQEKNSSGPWIIKNVTKKHYSDRNTFNRLKGTRILKAFLSGLEVS